MTHIRPETQALINRGNITLEEYRSFVGNSYEFEAMVPALDGEAFTYYVNHVVSNCSVDPRRPASTYNDAAILVIIPELLRRLENLQNRTILIDEQVPSMSKMLREHYEEIGATVTDVRMNRNHGELMEVYKSYLMSSTPDDGQTGRMYEGDYFEDSPLSSIKKK